MLNTYKFCMVQSDDVENDFSFEITVKADTIKEARQKALAKAEIKYQDDELSDYYKLTLLSIS